MGASSGAGDPIPRLADRAAEEVHRALQYVPDSMRGVLVRLGEVLDELAKHPVESCFWNGSARVGPSAAALFDLGRAAQALATAQQRAAAVVPKGVQDSYRQAVEDVTQALAETAGEWGLASKR